MPIPSSVQSLLYPALKAFLEARDTAIGETIDWDYDSDAYSPTDPPKGLIGVPHDRYDEQTFFDLGYSPIEWRVVLRLLVGATTRAACIAKAGDWNTHLVKSFRALKFGGTVYQGVTLWAGVEIEDHPDYEPRKNESGGYTAEIQFVLSWRDDGAVVGRD